MAKLILQFKGANIKEFLLEKPSITIGRDPKNDIVIDNLAVSRFHTKITHHDNTYFAEDLQSGNGTFLNEQRVAKEVLKHNDAITVGKHTLVFLYDPVFPATELGEAATSLLGASAAALPHMWKEQEQPPGALCYPALDTVGRRDRPRIGAVCPFVRLVSGVSEHIIGDRPRPDPVWETARFSVPPASHGCPSSISCDWRLP
jgi:predicted component of type VI protein secretion system